MIKVYNSGNDFILENKDFLDLNRYMAVFFYLDAKALNETNKKNYAIKAEADSKKLLAIKVEPYNLCLYGDFECLNELISYLYDNSYELNGVLCSTMIGDELIKLSKNSKNKYHLSIGMDFMEAKEFTEETSELVLKTCKNDLDELFELSGAFFKECGLPDVPDKEKLLDCVTYFRVIRENKKIVSMASLTKDTKTSYRITHVYTLPEYRGRGYARKIVNYIKNEIISLGFTATLNVDQKNPISYHLYESLGFKKVFSQGIYNKD